MIAARRRRLSRISWLAIAAPPHRGGTWGEHRRGSDSSPLRSPFPLFPDAGSSKFPRLGREFSRIPPRTRPSRARRAPPHPSVPRRHDPVNAEAPPRPLRRRRSGEISWRSRYSPPTSCANEIGTRRRRRFVAVRFPLSAGSEDRSPATADAGTTIHETARLGVSFRHANLSARRDAAGAIVPPSPRSRRSAARRRDISREPDANIADLAIRRPLVPGFIEISTRGSVTASAPRARDARLG